MSRLFAIIVSISFLLPGIINGQELQMKTILSKINNYRKANEHGIIREFFSLLSIPNVSSDHTNIRENAEFIKNMIIRRGINAQVLETKGNPVVFGELNVPGAKRTLAFYVHYDGQPVDPSEWTDTHPFKPVIRPGKLKAGSGEPKPILFPGENVPIDEDWRIYARGSSDDKAPIIALLTAIDAVRNSGLNMKNNLKFIFEGEEEAGSINIRPFLEKHKDLLKSDVLFMCDGPVYYSGDPTLFFGVRGVWTIEITVYGPNTSLHSGHYGNWAPNPAMILAQLLSTMKDDNGKVKIEGFYDTVIPLSKTELKALEEIPKYDEELKELYGFSFTEGAGKSLNEAIQYPSLNINGLSSGWVGNQVRTIIPPHATASIDIRLVNGNDPADMVSKVVNHIKNRGFHVVSEAPDEQTRAQFPLIAKVITSEEGYRASRTSMDLPISRAVRKALSGYSDKGTVLLPSLGGSLPLYVFNEVLDVPTIGVPIANHDNNQHQPDENIRIGHLWRGIETFAAIILME